MNEIIEKENIENKIYEIRGVQVMLDSDLAKLYHCVNGTKTINQAVKRNIARFPDDFYFQITTEEYNNLKSQIGTSSYNNYGGARKLPYAFTEQGVAMLATVIHTKEAALISINIMRAFVKMRHFIIENKDIYMSLSNINNKLIEHDEKLDYLFSKFDKKEQLFLPNTEYDAYSNFISIFKEANKELIIVDSYADITLLDIIKKIKCKIILITKDNNRLSNTDIEKYNKQYHNLTIIKNNDFHDRYFIIDNKIIYQSGTSINNAGTKTFSINLLEDEFIKKTILNEVCKTFKNN
jgi:sugar-specific transcriptional regulator TrmB